MCEEKALQEHLQIAGQHFGNAFPWECPLIPPSAGNIASFFLILFDNLLLIFYDCFMN